MKSALTSLLYAVVVVAAIAGIMTLCVRCGGGRSAPVPAEATYFDTVRVEITDTIKVAAPAPSHVAQLPDVIKRLPLWRPSVNDGAHEAATCGSFALDSVHESLIFARCCLDSVDVVVPMERKVYTDSANYRAVISGAWVSLDSVEVYPRREIVTIKQPPNRRKRWSVGPAVGFGWAGGKWTPMVGVVASYNLVQF